MRATGRACARACVVAGVVMGATLTETLPILYGLAPIVALAAVLFAAADRAERTTSNAQ